MKYQTKACIWHNLEHGNIYNFKLSVTEEEVEIIKLTYLNQKDEKSR